MKLDPAKIRQLREARGWTQEHLATVAGLSLRTVQRIEREGNASSDSRLALAAAFGVDLAEINALSEALTPPTADPHPKPQRDPKESFRQQLWLFAACSVLFLGYDLWPDHRLTWAFWPILGWGAGLALRARRLWAQPQMSDPSHRRHQVFRDHFTAWLLLSILFVVADLWQSPTLTWAFYPILGWGLGVFSHYRTLARG